MLQLNATKKLAGELENVTLGSRVSSEAYSAYYVYFRAQTSDSGVTHDAVFCLGWLPGLLGLLVVLRAASVGISLNSSTYDDRMYCCRYKLGRYLGIQPAVSAARILQDP